MLTAQQMTKEVLDIFTSIQNFPLPDFLLLCYSLRTTLSWPCNVIAVNMLGCVCRHYILSIHPSIQTWNFWKIISFHSEKIHNQNMNDLKPEQELAKAATSERFRYREHPKRRNMHVNKTSCVNNALMCPAWHMPSVVVHGHSLTTHLLTHHCTQRVLVHTGTCEESMWVLLAIKMKMQFKRGQCEKYFFNYINK